MSTRARPVHVADLNEERLDSSDPIAGPTRNGGRFLFPRLIDVVSARRGLGFGVAVLAVWLPLVGWWLAFRPGLMSSDTFGAWGQIRSGVWEDGTTPPPYTAALRIALALGGPSLLTLGQTLLLAVSVVALARSVRRLGANRIAVLVSVGFVAVSPAVGAFSISLWKDIPYAACLILLTAKTVDVVAAVRSNTAVRLGTWGGMGAAALAVSLLRSNAPLVVALAGAGVLVAFRQYWRPVVLTFAAVGVCFASIRLVVYPMADVETIDEGFAASAFVRDIAGVYREHPDAFTPGELELMASLLPLEYWSTYYFCPSVNTLYFLNPGIDQERQAEVADHLIALWRRLLFKEPGSILTTRICASTTAWRPWSTADLNIYTTNWPIIPNSFGQATDPVIDPLNRPYAAVLRWTDTSTIGESLLWRAPGYLYFFYGMVAVAAVRSRRFAPFALVVVPVAQQLTIMAVMVAPDARYMLVDQILAVLLLPAAIAWALHPLARRGVGSADADVTDVDVTTSGSPRPTGDSEVAHLSAQ